MLYSAGLILTVKRKSIIFSRYISIYLLIPFFFFHHSTDSFTNLHIPQPLMENAEKVIVMAKTIQRSAENYYKFNVARKIQPSK